MAQAKKKPVADAVAKKPARFEEDPQNQTETPEATILRLAKEVKQFSDWWHQDRSKLERAEQRVRDLEATLRSIANLARIDIGDFVERCDRAFSTDGNIPF